MNRLRLMMVVVVAVLTIALPAVVSAHPHTANGQVIANGQNHGSYSATGETCGGDPAAYGLESAHHGPDSGTPGKADGCYQLDSMPPTSDDHIPAID
jgi:hypothetical protein